MRPVAISVAVSALLLAAVGLGVWLWWPTPPGEPRFHPLDFGEVRLWTRPEELEARGQELRVAAPRAVVWLESGGRLGPVLFELRGRPVRVVVSSGGSQTEHPSAPPGSGKPLFMEWRPGEPRRYRSRPGLDFYRLVLSFPDLPTSGFPGEETPGEETPRLAFLGTRELLDRDYYGVEWLGCGAPEAVRRGEEIPVLLRLRNTSAFTWPATGNARVRLAWRWIAEGGPSDEFRTDLEAPVGPGSELARWLRPRAPGIPGRHTLELDLAFEPLATFSEKGAPTCRAGVIVE